MLNVLFTAFIVVLVIQIYFYLFVFLRTGFRKAVNPKMKNIGISVIVCAKNEAENLRKHLPLIIEQDYAKFEIILVNDNSSDHSLEIMREFEMRNQNIRVVDVKPVDSFWNNKKYPLTLGIKAAKYDYILLTDADCYPSGKDWISTMSRYFSNQKSIVIGYGGYKRIKSSFLNLVIRFETVFTAMQYFSHGLLGNPYMGVGRNLAYRKDEFLEGPGFSAHISLPSGDDDLFVNAAATDSNTAFCFNADGFTYSEPKRSFKSWFRQKKRHVSSSNYYKFRDKFTLTLFYLSQFLFYTISLALLILGYKWTLVAALIFGRFLLAWWAYGMHAIRFKEKDTILFFPLTEVFLIISQLAIFISNLSSKKHSWN